MFKTGLMRPAALVIGRSATALYGSSLQGLKTRAIFHHAAARSAISAFADAMTNNLSRSKTYSTLLWSKSLGDPLGGTELANGRHQVKLYEPKAADDAPEFAPFLLLGSLQFSEACLRVYGHPQLLKIAEEINGEDFTPFNESLFFKEPGVGAAVSWHQDGSTHWDSPDFDGGIHGFNFMAQVYGSTAVNGVWVLSGSHTLGKINIKEMVERSGSKRIEGTVPLVCYPGEIDNCCMDPLPIRVLNRGSL